MPYAGSSGFSAFCAWLPVPGFLYLKIWLARRMDEKARRLSLFLRALHFHFHTGLKSVQVRVSFSSVIFPGLFFRLSDLFQPFLPNCSGCCFHWEQTAQLQKHLI